MAVKTPNTDQNPEDISRDGSALRFSWSGANALANGDSTSPIPFCEFADRSVQVLGTFGAGGTIVFEGSNDGGATYATLNDLSGGNAWSKTAAGIDGVAEITQLARARVTGGDGTTSLEVHVVLRRSNPRGR